MNLDPQKKIELENYVRQQQAQGVAANKIITFSR
jgi:hypothetical protein